MGFSIMVLPVAAIKPRITGAPLLGEHTDEVLAKLGYSARQIAEPHTEKVG